MHFFSFFADFCGIKTLLFLLFSEAERGRPKADRAKRLLFFVILAVLVPHKRYKINTESFTLFSITDALVC